jgi:predicted tellurium resistance membrane protein TerC
MFFWFIKTIIVSIFLIALVDHLFHFFKSTLTVPKIKDLVNTTNQSYKNIYNTLHQNENNYEKNNENNSENNNCNNEYTLINLLPKSDLSMKDELKHFLKNQLQENTQQVSNFSFDSFQ